MTHRLRTTGIVMFSYSKSNSKLNLFKNQAYLIEYVMALKLLKDLLNLKYSMKKASLDWQKCQLLRLPPTKMMGVLGACFKRDKAGDCEKLLHALPAARALDNCEHIRVDCPIQTYQSRLVFPHSSSTGKPLRPCGSGSWRGQPLPHNKTIKMTTEEHTVTILAEA